MGITVVSLPCTAYLCESFPTLYGLTILLPLQKRGSCAAYLFQTVYLPFQYFIFNKQNSQTLTIRKHFTFLNFCPKALLRRVGRLLEGGEAFLQREVIWQVKLHTGMPYKGVTQRCLIEIQMPVTTKSRE